MEIIAVIFGYSFIGAFFGFAVYSICEHFGIADFMEDVVGIFAGILWPISIPVLSGVFLALYCIKRMFIKKGERL